MSVLNVKQLVKVHKTSSCIISPRAYSRTSVFMYTIYNTPPPPPPHPHTPNDNSEITTATLYRLPFFGEKYVPTVTLWSCVSKLRPTRYFNNAFSHSRPKRCFPYHLLSTNATMFPSSFEYKRTAIALRQYFTATNCFMTLFIYNFSFFLIMFCFLYRCWCPSTYLCLLSNEEYHDGA